MWRATTSSCAGTLESFELGNEQRFSAPRDRWAHFLDLDELPHHEDWPQLFAAYPEFGRAESFAQVKEATERAATDERERALYRLLLEFLAGQVEDTLAAKSAEVCPISVPSSRSIIGEKAVSAAAITPTSALKISLPNRYASATVSAAKKALIIRITPKRTRRAM